MYTVGKGLFGCKMFLYIVEENLLNKTKGT